MTQAERRVFLIQHLLSAMSAEQRADIVVPQNTGLQRLLLRTLLRSRQTPCLNPEFIKIQDEYLTEMIQETGIIDVKTITPVCNDIHLFLGDITALNSDAIACPVNENLVGLPYPYPNALDNLVHLFAGEQLKQELREILAQQQEPLHIGQAFMTDAYNLPSKKIINSVAPTFQKQLTPENKDDLMKTTIATLTCADKNGIHTLGFAKLYPYKSRVPSQEAARVVTNAILEYKKATKSQLKIYFSMVSPSTLEYFSSLIHTEANTFHS